MSGAEIGPKAESLRALVAAGLPVPEVRFLDADAYRRHADAAGISRLLTAAGDTPLDSAAMRDAIRAIPLAEDVAETLRAWYLELGEVPLAVRSSANEEDLPDVSFAGQHGTYFVGDVEELLACVRHCWASLFSERAVRYREYVGLGHDDVAMAVIVQRLVPALAAGVAFTANPLSGADEIHVEACLGIGEALVSGKVTPDRFVFARDGLIVREVIAGNKCVRIALEGDGPVVELEVAPDAAAALCIAEDTAREVARFALVAEGLLGTPADIEWALDGEQLWLLQARPITTLPRPAAQPATAAPAAPAAPEPAASPAPSATPGTIWSNVNTGEILPDVATPITWSIIHGHAEEIFGGMFGALGVRIDASEIVGLVGGRFYFNLSMMRDSFKHLPGVNPDIALGGMHDYVELPPQTPGTGGGAGILGIVRAAVSLPSYIVRHTPKKAARFTARMRAKTDGAEAALAARPDADEAFRLLHRLIAQFSVFADALAFMAVAMFGFGVLGGICKAWLGDESGALAAQLVAGRGGVSSAESGHALWRLGVLARDAVSVRDVVSAGGEWSSVRAALAEADASDARAFLAQWDAFMREHGHHRRGELEFANPTWAEEPDYILGIVRGYAARDAGADPMAAYAERAAEADAAAEQCRARLRNPLKRAAFNRVLTWGRASAAARENTKSEAVRWLVAIRHALLLLGERLTERGELDRPDDIFFLEWNEIGGEMAGFLAGDTRPLIASRRAERARLEGLSPPPVVVGDWNEADGPWTVSSDTRTLKGITVSAGVARGPARVFTSVDIDEAVLPGEILVAPFTDPGWTPYFVPAAGIVMDMGGLLSHGSIIAREYGIPAVVNVGPATQLIKTGQLIEVDGDTGEVRILGSS